MIDKSVVLSMFRNKLSYVQIAKELGCSPDAVEKCLKRNFPKEVEKRKEERNKNSLKKSITQKDDEIVFLRSFGNNPNVCRMSDSAFISWNRQAYKTDMHGKLHYDEDRNGLRAEDVPEVFEISNI